MTASAGGSARLAAGAARMPGPARVPRQGQAQVAWDDAAETLALLSGKWVLAILRVLHEQGARRHNQLHRAIEGNITARSLDATLKRMGSDGLIERRVGPGTPPAVSYRLTPLGRSLLGPLAELGRWSAANPRGPLPQGPGPRGNAAA